MSQPWYETPKFLKQRKEWYDKIKRKGFKDIENINWANGESGDRLNGMNQQDMVRNYTPEQERYYELARAWQHVLENTVWEVLEGGVWGPYGGGQHPAVLGTDHRITDVRKVWAYHAEGRSMRAVEREIGIPRDRASDMARHQEELMLKNLRLELLGSQVSDDDEGHHDCDDL